MTVGRAVRGQRLIAIVRERSAEDALRTGRRLLASGIRCVEVSLVTPGATQVIAELRRHRDGLAQSDQEPAFIGVGTVLSLEALAESRVAGAEFVVTPNLDESVVRACVSAGVAVYPGVLSPTEALQARRWGADAIKLFPASTWTPAALRDLLGALPDLPMIPTGGITLERAADWIAAGAVAVGMGSALSRGDEPTVQANCRTLLADLAQAR